MTKSAYQKLRRRVSKQFESTYKNCSIMLRSNILGALLTELNETKDEEKWTEERHEKQVMAQLLLDSLIREHSKLEFDRLRHSL